MTQEQARLVFNMAVEGFKAYKRETLRGEHTGRYLASKLSALSALSAEFGERFEPETKGNGYFRITPRLLA